MAPCVWNMYVRNAEEQTLYNLQADEIENKEMSCKHCLHGRYCPLYQ